MSKDEAYDWLKELSGLDFGYDIKQWEAWVKEQNKHLPPKFPLTRRRSPNPES